LPTTASFHPQKIYIAALVLMYVAVVMIAGAFYMLAPTVLTVAAAVVVLVALALIFSWYATVVITVGERALSRKAWGNTVTVWLRDIRASQILYTQGRRSGICITLMGGAAVTIPISSLSSKDQEWLIHCPGLRVGGGDPGREPSAPA
jgi:hypothetical protein